MKTNSVPTITSKRKSAKEEMILKNFIYGLSIVIALPLIAQEPAIEKDTIAQSLGEVVVTAQRSKRQNLYVPYSVNVIFRQTLDEFNPRTTPEALVGMNGVFIQKTNHGGGSPFVRGLTGNQTLILVDGIRLNNSTFRYGPNQYLNTIDAYTINRIEVAKGTGSVQYGTDAIGGALHIITREPDFTGDKQTVKGNLIGKYMTGDMEKTVRGEVQYSGKKFAFLTGASKRDFGDLIGGDTTGKQSPSGYDEWSFDVKAKFLLNGNIQLVLANQFLRQQHVPVYHKVQLENFSLNEMSPQQRLFSYAKLSLPSHSPLFKETEFIISFQQGTEGRNSRKSGSTILRKERDKVSTIGITADVASVFNKIWTANSGIEVYTDRVGSKREDIHIQTGVSSTKRGLYPDDSKYGNYSLYSLHHFRYGKWIADAGLRFNTFDIRITDTSLGNVNITPSALVANAAVMYAVSHRQTIYIAYCSGYRAPNVDDMGTLGIVDFRYEVPTDNLHPEKSAHTELGYKLQTKKFSGTAALYYMHLSNLITRVKEEGQFINGYQVYRKENTESAVIKGVEASFNWQLLQYLGFNGGVSYTSGQNLTKNEPLRRVPPFNGKLMSTYRNGKWFAAVEMQFASKQSRLAQGDKEDNRIPAGGTPGWNVYNLYSGCKTEKIQLGVGLQNLFNEDYRTHGSGINGAGRSAWASVSIKI
jgi:outer membrane cobalamin receptor